ncbi:MAG: flagellar hook-associated protein 3 [Burkholderiales bacterium]|nr:MAG: flagellar hook-associated protein 3 [Burkholderiales bacterium]
MRIATAFAQQVAINGITDRQSQLLDTQNQLSSGRRVNSPSDDPAAAAEAERLRSRESRLGSEQRAIDQARQMLGSADGALADATDLMQSARESLLAAGNASTGPADRAKYAEQLRQVREQLLSVANRTDGAGGFVFGGQGAVAAPIDASGTVYTPPAGTQLIGQDMANPVALDGRENFTAIRTGSGTESIFAQLDAAIATLSDTNATVAVSTTAARTALSAVDRSLDRFSFTRTMVGERLKAIDAHEQAVATGSIDNQARLADLVDVDFAKTISAMNQHQTALEAAMKSYATISKMSLFDYV